MQMSLLNPFLLQNLLMFQPPTQSASSTKTVTPQNQVIPVWPCGDHSNPALRRDYLENNNRGIILLLCRIVEHYRFGIPMM